MIMSYTRRMNVNNLHYMCRIGALDGGDGGPDLLWKQGDKFLILQW